MHKYLINELHKIKESVDKLEDYFSGFNHKDESNGTLEITYDKKTGEYIIKEQQSNNPYDNLRSDIAKIKKDIPNKKANALTNRGDIKMKLKEGSISKRKDGRWHARYYNNGKRMHIYAKTKKEAIAKLNKAISKRNRENKNKIILNTTTLNNWIEQYMKLYKSNMKTATSKDYQFNLVDKVSGHLIGKKQVSDITPMMLDKFLYSIKAESSRARTFQFLKAAFKKLVQNKVIKENPFDFVDPIRKPKTGEKKTPTREELNEFFKYLETKNYNLFLFAKFISITGMRKGEALALKWSDINSRININTAFSTASGKIETPKTVNSVRTIPLFTEAKEILSNIDHTEDIIFNQISKWQCSRMFSNYAINFGLNGLTLHVLRHYFATQCLQAGIAEKVTSAWLGHSNSLITKDIYQHINIDFEQEQLEILARYKGIKK